MNKDLAIRQYVCDLVNSLTGWSIWCGPSESVLGLDQTAQGEINE